LRSQSQGRASSYPDCIYGQLQSTLSSNKRHLAS